jgi:hypothetical protein
MPNTVIALKKSATALAVPTSLANGELALNYADGKIYYKNTAGFIVEFAPTTSSNYFGTVNANSTLLVADTSNDILSIAPGNNINIVGDAVNDKVTIGLKDDVAIPGLLSITAASGDEGGEIRLANAITNSLLAGPVNIDIFRNQLRFFVAGGDARGAFINLAATSATVGTDLLAAASATDATARATANAALPNVSGVSFNGNLTVTQNLTSDRVITLNNGNGENFRVGDDTWIGDTNLANALRIKGQQNASIGYVMFGPNDGKLLGRDGAGPLTYDANTIWHAGNDGASSGLDADLLDGQHGSYYGTAVDVTAAFDKANAANVLAFNTGIGANAWANSISTAGNNYTIAVGTAGNNYTNAVGTAGNNYTISVGTAGNNYTNAVGAAANGWANSISTTRSTASNAYATAVGIAGNNFTTTVGTAGNNYVVSVSASVGTAGNNYTIAVGSAGNNYTIAVGVASNGWTNTVGTDAKSYANSTFVKLTASSQTITGNLSVVGSLTISGNTTIVNAENLSVSDPLIYLAGNNYTSDIVDIGFIGNYVNATGSNVHTGLYREHVDKMYYLFQGYDKEPENNHIGALSNNMSLAVLNADLRTSNLLLGGVNTINWITASFNKANAALSNTSGTTFTGVLNVSENVTTKGLNVTSNVINFGSAMSILPNGMIMIYGDINMLT